MRIASFQRFLGGCYFVQDLLEPKLINLVNSYEQKLIVLRAIAERLLQGQ
jgi:hypothetical protein